MNRTDDAFSTLEFLIVLVFLLLLTAAFALVLNTAKIQIERENRRLDDKKQIEQVLSDALDLLKADKTPESDSRTDAFWQLNGSVRNDCTVELRSLSSSLNPNFIQKGVYEGTELAALFTEKASPTLLTEMREQNGLFFSYNDVSSCFLPETYRKYFSSYGWANINTADEGALQLLIQERTGSAAGAELLLQKVHQLRAQKQQVHSETELKLVCGVLYDELFPYVNAAPSMNVQFMEPEVLEDMLSYQPFGISGGRNKAAQLIALRETAEISEDELVSIIGMTNANVLYSYLGTVTWFWSITISKGTRVCRVIMCRYPEEDALKKTEWRKVEEKWD